MDGGPLAWLSFPCSPAAWLAVGATSASSASKRSYQIGPSILSTWRAACQTQRCTLCFAKQPGDLAVHFQFSDLLQAEATEPEFHSISFCKLGELHFIHWPCHPSATTWCLGVKLTRRHCEKGEASKRVPCSKRPSLPIEPPLRSSRPGRFFVLIPAKGSGKLMLIIIVIMPAL